MLENPSKNLQDSLNSLAHLDNPGFSYDIMTNNGRKYARDNKWNIFYEGKKGLQPRYILVDCIPVLSCFSKKVQISFKFAFINQAPVLISLFYEFK